MRISPAVKRCTLAVICLKVFAVSAQTISFSNVPRINPRSSYNRVIGENPNGVYLLRMKNPDARQGVEIEWYSHNLNFMRARYLNMGSGRMLRIFQTQGGICYFHGKGDRNRGAFVVSSYKLNHALDDVQQKNRMFEFDHYDFYKDNVEVDQDRNNRYAAIYADSRDGSGKQIIDVAVVDSSLQPVYRQVKLLETAADAFRINDLAVDPAGNVYILAGEQRKDKRKGDPASVRHVVYAFNRHTESWNTLEINESQRFISHARIAYNDSLNTMVVAGAYGLKSPESAYGIFVMHISCHDQRELTRHFTPIDREFVAGIIGAQQEAGGEDLANFRVRRVIPRTDGGTVIIAERYFVTQQVETFYVSGIPQTTTTNLYHYDDILVMSLDRFGNMEWRNAIRKRQSGMAGTALYSGVATCINSGAVHVLYNDYSRTNGDVMQHTLYRDGTTDQRIVLQSENYFTAIIPAEGKQTGYNRIVLTCLRNRQVSLMKLSY